MEQGGKNIEQKGWMLEPGLTIRVINLSGPKGNIVTSEKLMKIGVPLLLKEYHLYVF